MKKTIKNIYKSIELEDSPMDYWAKKVAKPWDDSTSDGLAC